MVTSFSVAGISIQRFVLLSRAANNTATTFEGMGSEGFSLLHELGDL
jgi:hypothetical protein